MKISTKGRYGARAMLTIAKTYGDGPVRSAEIADEQGISRKYLESILATLKLAGLLNAERGNKGGYTLTRPPSQITLYDILTPLEDFLGVVHCTENPHECGRIEECKTRRVWQELKDAVEEILRNRSLQDLLDAPAGHDDLIA